MANYRGFDFLDFLVVLARKKKFLIILFLITAIFSYIAIYYLITPQYDSVAVIVTTEENQLGPYSSLISQFSSLPLGSLGFGSFNSSDRYNLFTTIIYSRTNLEDMMNKFHLKDDYKIKSTETMILLLKKLIDINITDELAYEIKVRAISPEKSAEMTNYLLQKVNNVVIEMNTKKARDNRLFMEDRYKELMVRVTNSEDSLRIFQEKTGMLEADNQTKSIIEAYTKLESDLAVKQIEAAVAEQLIGENSPQAKNLRALVDELKKQMNLYATGKSDNKIMLPLSKLPQNAMEYYRHYRDVEIYNAMLEFVVPLYEQSKFQEVNSVPVLQIIDKAVPPEKKSYPPRLLFTLLISFFVLSVASMVIFAKEWLSQTTNERIKIISKEIRSFRKRSDNI